MSRIKVVNLSQCLKATQLLLWLNKVSVYSVVYHVLNRKSTYIWTVSSWGLVEVGLSLHELKFDFLSYISVYVMLQVQGELKRKWRSMCLNCRLSRDRHYNSTFASRNGSEHMVQFHRNSRTQSILQSETTVLWGPDGPFKRINQTVCRWTWIEQCYGWF